MGSPERPSGQGKKDKVKTIRVRSKKGFSRPIPVTDLSKTEEYHPEGLEVDAEKLLEFVRAASREKIGLGRKRVRVY